MGLKATTLMLIIFSLSILFTASSCRLHISLNSVQVQEGNKGSMATNCKLKADELVQNIKFAAAHGGGVAHGSSAGHGEGGGVAHGSSAGHGEGGTRGDGNGESSSTPGTANVIPVYGAAAARRGHQSHKGGAHSNTCSLSMLATAIFLSLFF